MNQITQAIQESDEAFCRGFERITLEAPNDDTKDLVRSNNRKILEAVIALSEREEDLVSTSTEEWRGFKGLRNALIDAIKDIK